MCNHLLGYISSYDYKPIYFGDILDRLKWEVEIQQEMFNIGLIKKLFEPKDYLDRRKNLITMFNCCPYCGEKINWNKIKAFLK